MASFHHSKWSSQLTLVPGLWCIRQANLSLLKKSFSCKAPSRKPGAGIHRKPKHQPLMILWKKLWLKLLNGNLLSNFWKVKLMLIFPKSLVRLMLNVSSHKELSSSAIKYLLLLLFAKFLSVSSTKKDLKHCLSHIANSLKSLLLRKILILPRSEIYIR